MWGCRRPASSPYCISQPFVNVVEGCRPRLRAALNEEKQRDTFVHMRPITQHDISYIGRPVSATTATAAFWIHAHEQSAIIEEALLPGIKREALVMAGAGG
jgi:hypothetical protein